MPKRGNVIDPETAELIKNTLLPIYDWDTRPVLWPDSKVDDIVASLRSDAALIVEKECQRNLAHFVCLDEVVRLLIVRARSGRYGKIYVMAIDDLFVPYDFSKGGPIHVVTRFLMGSQLGLESCLTISKENRKVIEAGGIAMFRTEDLESRPVEDRQAVAMARVLEHYAFSPYTTYKQRPTLQQAFERSNSARPMRTSPKAEPAIEVVHLRIPKRPEHYEPSGKHINIRYTVTEHLRRQPTKAGIKLITIKEHKRGPIDAPEKPKRTKVYKVVN